jgi:N-acetyl-gamma-glutamyl-phosphate reductase
MITAIRRRQDHDHADLVPELRIWFRGRREIDERPTAAWCYSRLHSDAGGLIMGVRVAVAGASGYAGGELLRLLAGHPELEITTATAHSSAGEPVASIHPHLIDLGLTFGATDAATLSGADLVFFALPHGESAAVAKDLASGVKVVDLGADHRLIDPAAWEAYYPGPHAGAWTYGLPELPGQREKIAASTRVAATGCYAVATVLALAPLIAAGVASPDDVVVVASSGTTGAGRGLKQHLMASEVMGDLSPYKVGSHQHVPEIKQASGARTLSFTPVLAPMPRGILATVAAVPAQSTVDALDVLARAYDKEPFVRVLPDGVWPHTGATLGSNACHLQATVDRDSGRLLVVSAIDNLGKGAAGQAVQCANLMLGLPETAGLSTRGVNP